MRDSYDIVVVGGGSNSLTAAAYLAKIGKSVVVLEKNDHCGGGVVSVAPAPGFTGDPHATGMVICLANPALTHDELGLESRFGLEWAYTEATFATVFDDNTGLITWNDLDRTCESIAKFSERDAQTYRNFVLESQALLPLFLKSYFAPPLPVGGFIGMLEQTAKGRRMVTNLLDSAYDVLERTFESPELKMHIMKWCAELMMAPEVKGTGIVPTMLLGIAHSRGAGAVVGGSANLTKAIIRCIEHYGGEIRTNSQVVKVRVSGGRAVGVELADGSYIAAKDAVVGSIHPWDLGKLVEGVDPEVAAAAEQVTLSSFGAINQQIALSEAPKWKAGDEYSKSMLVECVQRDYLALRKSFDAYRYGEMPAGHLSPLIAVQSLHDPSRAPAGKAAMYLYHFAPLELANGGLAAWDDVKEHWCDAIYDEMCKYTTNLDRSSIIGTYRETPLDHHRHSASMKHGDIFGCGTTVSQFMGRRPIPELAQYTVPGLKGFYLAGPFLHPGGAVTLGGRATAMKMLMDWKMDLKKAFVSL
ncbi:NAD(P)/FAD-dependent oxidoreductase [Burkholderia sp. Ac-20353]|uniref:FAD-dependent oxidoreductase n=1 Tax=Burkholderia sp. Ac-20353 TaxID=2703894 RepID=UPI00197C1DF7|nr:NAD(P)/FAD-dependent oxidoreductase [Burkholderia sp. Ac-20353]